MAGPITSYDIVANYDWTSIPRNSPLREEAPYVEILSFKLNANQIQQAFLSYVEIAKNLNTSGHDFYDKMYSAATGNKIEEAFKFPYFADGIREFSNTFSDTFQSGIGGTGGAGNELNEIFKRFVGEAAQLQGAFAGGETSEINIFGKKFNLPLGRPGTYVETPMFYQFEKNDGPIDVTFILSNTISQDSIGTNFALVRHLTEINRPFRENSIAVTPPRIYRVVIPGHRQMRWAYCSNFSVSMLGARRMIGKIIIPEGYQISMQFQSLTLEHSGFLNDSFVGNTEFIESLTPDFVGPPAPANAGTSPETKTPVIPPANSNPIDLNQFATPTNGNFRNPAPNTAPFNPATPRTDNPADILNFINGRR